MDSYYPVKLNGQHYIMTTVYVRTASCTLLVRGSKCTPCKKYRAVLRALWSKSKKQGSQSSQSTQHAICEYLLINMFSKESCSVDSICLGLLYNVYIHAYVLGESSRKRPIEVVPEQPVKQAAPQTGKE